MTKPIFNALHSVLALAAAIGLSGAVEARSYDQLDRSMRIYNGSSKDLVEFYASNKGTGDWFEDLLGPEILDSGRSVTLDLDDGSGYCKYDFRAVFDDGSVKTDWDVNVCELSNFRYR